MTTLTGAAPPTHSTPLALARGFLTGGVAGASLAALVVGAITETVPLFVAGFVLPALYGLLLFLAGIPTRAREAAVVPRTALAVIGSLKAVGGETSDPPVRFDLTVVPDDGPASRVDVTQDINLVDLPGYRPGGVVVVQYPPDRPWRARIVERPTPEWEERAASARLDAVPEPGIAAKPQESPAFGFVVLFGLLVGAALVVLLFREDLFGRDAGAKASPSARPSVSASSSSTVVSSVSATATLGPGRSFLDPGELDRAFDALTRGGDARQALTVVVQERLLSIVFSPAGARTPGFDPKALPHGRFPALVDEATATLGTHSPHTWRITADRLTGSLVIRVVATGAEGTASLEADGRGRVVRRAPAP